MPRCPLTFETVGGGVTDADRAEDVRPSPGSHR
jgi:hypothetical protein